MQPFVDSTDLIMDGAALAQRMDRDGYLFIRDLLPMDLGGDKAGSAMLPYCPYCHIDKAVRIVPVALFACRHLRRRGPPL